MKLELLSRALDPANKNILQAHREKGGGYEKFMKSLDGRDMNDVQEYHRKKWHSLDFPNPKRITREDLREFGAQFERNKNRVGDTNPEEEYNLLMSKLPQFWREKVIGEEERLNREKYWLRIGKMGDFEKAEVEEFLAMRASEYSVQVLERDNFFLVQFHSEEARDQILALHGRRVWNFGLVVARYRAKLSVGEILQWMEGKMQIQETAAAWTEKDKIRAFKGENASSAEKSQRSPSPKNSDRGENSHDSQGKGKGKGGKGKGKGEGQGKGNGGNSFQSSTPPSFQQNNPPHDQLPAAIFL
jgi:hypothetical protein